MTSTPSLPLVDIGPLTEAWAATDGFADGPPTDRPAVDTLIEQIHGACLDTGFFVVVGHGLDEEMAALFDAGRRFFALAPADKERIPRVNRYGYVPHAAQAIDSDRQSDRSEYLDLGLGDEVPLPDVAGFEATVRRYQAAALDRSKAILAALAIALGAEPSFFADRMARPQCKLRFLHYPPVEPAADGTLPVPTTPHTDYGAITMLATDGVPGLEVLPIDRPWLPVEAPAGALVVNLGDLLARWTNDRYRSTPHRVVGPATGERFSIPFFINPDPDTEVVPIASCVTAERPARYGPVTAAEFLAARIDGTDEPYIDPTAGPARRVES